MFCTTAFKFAGTAGTTLGVTSTSTAESSIATGAKLSLEFAYTTSGDALYAGSGSDAFLTPSLNVKFAKSAQIDFNATSCGVAYKEIISWSLDSDKNVPVWRSA